MGKRGGFPLPAAAAENLTLGRQLVVIGKISSDAGLASLFLCQLAHLKGISSAPVGFAPSCAAPGSRRGARGGGEEKPAVCVQGDCHGYLPDKTNGST